MVLSNVSTHVACLLEIWMIGNLLPAVHFSRTNEAISYGKVEGTAGTGALGGTRGWGITEAFG